MREGFVLNNNRIVTLTFAICSIPCKVMSERRLASRQRRNVSSSILSSCSPSSYNTEKENGMYYCLISSLTLLLTSPAYFCSSLFINLIRRTSFSALSSLKIQFKSSPNVALIFSAICSMVSFLSVILLRSNSKRSSQGEIWAGLKSGIS